MNTKTAASPAKEMHEFLASAGIEIDGRALDNPLVARELADLQALQSSANAGLGRAVDEFMDRYERRWERLLEAHGRSTQ